MSDLTKEQLEDELQKAYRALGGFYHAFVKGEKPNQPMVIYHSLTIGAAIRYLKDEQLDGSQYFIGKPAEVLRNVLYQAQ